MTVLVHGIAQCDQVRRTLTWFRAQSLDHKLHDFRRDGLLPEQLDRWLERVGWENLLNRRGTTWRQLDPLVRAQVTSDATARPLLLAHPTLIRRPVIEHNGHLHIGFDAEALSRIMGCAA